VVLVKNLLTISN